MDYLLLAFGVFFIITAVQSRLAAPDWFWFAAFLALSVLSLWLWGDLDHWYAAPVVSGIGVLILRVESLLLVKADESLYRIKTRR